MAAQLSDIDHAYNTVTAKVPLGDQFCAVIKPLSPGHCLKLESKKGRDMDDMLYPGLLMMLAY